MFMDTLTYEDSVQWMRSQLEHSELVKLCYLDEDNFIAACRFSSSEEFYEVKKLLNLNDSSQRLRVLDLGCGNGIVSYAFASLGYDVVAVDPDLSEDVGLGATQRLASSLQSGTIKTIQSFAESLPFADETFDIVYARQSLHHFSDLHQGLAECFRVLKMNGKMFGTREHVISDEKQLSEFLENHLLHKFHCGENAHTLNKYIAVLKQSGFMKVKAIGPFDSVINHFPASNADIKRQISQSLCKKIGKPFASLLSQSSFVERSYRQYYSHKCDSPGRLYSFLCIK
jgi:ubiquinone/menaquinone biosynthesis C-methylase UbiE